MLDPRSDRPAQTPALPYGKLVALLNGIRLLATLDRIHPDNYACAVALIPASGRSKC